MKKTFLLLWAAAFMGMFLPGCNGSKSGSSDVVDLKLNLQKGKSYTYNTKTTMNMDMTMMGKQMTTTGNIDFGFKMKVEDVDAQNNYNITAAYDAIRFKINAMGMDMGYDSKNPGDTSHENMMNGMFRKIFSSMLGQSFKLSMSPKGEVMKIEGIQDLVEKMSNNINVPEQMKEQMRKQMKESFNEEQIRQSFAQGFYIYPDKPVKVGDSWKKSFDKTMNNMKMNQDLKYTVKEITDNGIILELDGIISSSVNTDSTAAPKIDISGDEKGTMEMNRATGLIQKGTIDMNMKMSAAGNPMTMKVKTIIEGKE